MYIYDDSPESGYTILLICKSQPGKYNDSVTQKASEAERKTTEIGRNFPLWSSAFSAALCVYFIRILE